MKKLILIALFSAFVFSSCKSDDDEVSCETKINNVLEAAQTYLDDDSVANCNAYKTAFEASLGCYGDQAGEDAAQANIDALTCE